MHEIREKALTYGFDTLSEEEITSLAGRKKGQTIEQWSASMQAKAFAAWQTRRESLPVFKITHSSNVVQALSFLREKDVEEFWVLVLNRNNHVIGKFRSSIGGVSGTVVDIKTILAKVATEYPRSQGLIVCHNHPSGNTSPSQADIDITKKLKNAAELLDLKLLDSVIIAGKDHYSFADNGLL